MMNEYSIICEEVLNVLNRIPQNQLELIPNSVIEYLKLHSKSCNKYIQLKFDKLGNPILSKQAKAMIVLLYQKYFLDERIRELFFKKIAENTNKKKI